MKVNWTLGEYKSGYTGAQIDAAVDDIPNKAPTIHSSVSGEYGIASTTKFGHVKLTTDLNENLDASSGTAVDIGALNILKNDVVIGHALAISSDQIAFTCTYNNPNIEFKLVDAVSVIISVNSHCKDNPTLNVNDTGIRPLVRISGERLEENDFATNSTFKVTYSLQLLAWVVSFGGGAVIPQPGSITADMIVDGSVPSSALSDVPSFSAGTYTKFTVDARGNIISGSNVGLDDLNVYPTSYMDNQIADAGKGNFTFKGYFSTGVPVLPGGITPEVGTLYTIVADGATTIPVTFPLSVYTWNGTAWTGPTSSYTPTMFNIWSDLRASQTEPNGNHPGYYWFAGSWNRLDYEGSGLENLRSSAAQDIIDATKIRNNSTNSANNLTATFNSSGYSNIPATSTLAAIFGYLKQTLATIIAAGNNIVLFITRGSEGRLGMVDSTGKLTNAEFPGSGTINPGYVWSNDSAFFDPSWVIGGLGELIIATVYNSSSGMTIDNNTIEVSYGDIQVSSGAINLTAAIKKATHWAANTAGKLISEQLSANYNPHTSSNFVRSITKAFSAANGIPEHTLAVESFTIDGAVVDLGVYGVYYWAEFWDQYLTWSIPAYPALPNTKSDSLEIALDKFNTFYTEWLGGYSEYETGEPKHYVRWTSAAYTDETQRPLLVWDANKMIAENLANLPDPATVLTTANIGTIYGLVPLDANGVIDMNYLSYDDFKGDDIVGNRVYLSGRNWEYLLTENVLGAGDVYEQTVGIPRIRKWSNVMMYLDYKGNGISTSSSTEFLAAARMFKFITIDRVANGEVTFRWFPTLQGSYTGATPLVPPRDIQLVIVYNNKLRELNTNGVIHAVAIQIRPVTGGVFNTQEVFGDSQWIVYKWTGGASDVPVEITDDVSSTKGKNFTQLKLTGLGTQDQWIVIRPQPGYEYQGWLDYLMFSTSVAADGDILQFIEYNGPDFPNYTPTP
jgi:hypothetical protein